MTDRLVRHDAGGHMPARAKQAELFEVASPLPAGMVYVPDFITPGDEAALLQAIRELPLHEARYKAYTAKRRIASFGSQYDFSASELLAAPALPPFLQPLRQKVAGWLGLDAAELGHALVTEYRPGTPLGWHRDVPQFGVVVGVSLAGRCRMRLRPYPPRADSRRDTLILELEPRSAYTLRGDARWRWQHSIAPTKELRYSVTFRTRNPNTT